MRPSWPELPHEPEGQDKAANAADRPTQHEPNPSVASFKRAFDRLIHVGDHFGEDEGTGDPANQTCQDGDERAHLRAILPASPPSRQQGCLHSTLNCCLYGPLVGFASLDARMNGPDFRDPPAPTAQGGQECER